jgi:class 3 adenylate cyclase
MFLAAGWRILAGMAETEGLVTDLSEFRDRKGDATAPPGAAVRTGLPVGTVTFLVTDIEGSTRARESDRAAMAAAVARHYDLLDAAVSAHGGVRPVEQGEGDSVVAAFAGAGDAVAAALDAQLLCWPKSGQNPLSWPSAWRCTPARRRSGKAFTTPGHLSSEPPGCEP